MDLKKTGREVLSWIQKNKFVVLVLVIGIALMLLPGSQTQEGTAQIVQAETDPASQDISAALEQTLSQISGVGRVQVMLTYSIGAKTVYQEDEDRSETDSGTTIRRETVIVTGTDRGQEALISHVEAPKYLGVVVVCQGADQPAVKLAVLDAVSKATGLSSSSIAVVKMK